jgi:hypothetical protein
VGQLKEFQHTVFGRLKLRGFETIGQDGRVTARGKCEAMQKAKSVIYTGNHLREQHYVHAFHDKSIHGHI